MKIGFVGLGAMGFPMAGHLQIGGCWGTPSLLARMQHNPYSKLEPS